MATDKAENVTLTSDALVELEEIQATLTAETASLTEELGQGVDVDRAAKIVSRLQEIPTELNKTRGEILREKVDLRSDPPRSAEMLKWVKGMFSEFPEHAQEFLRAEWILDKDGNVQLQDVSFYPRKTVLPAQSTPNGSRTKTYEMWGRVFLSKHKVKIISGPDGVGQVGKITHLRDTFLPAEYHGTTGTMDLLVAFDKCGYELEQID